MKSYKWQILYNSKSSGLFFFTKKEAKKKWQELWDKNLYGYTLSEKK